MIVNVCCSGSSGSTLLSHVLNRHPALACGDELGLFSKPVGYDRFDYLKKKAFLIKNFGISSNPYFPEASILRNLGSYRLNRNAVWRWVRESADIRALAEKFRWHVLALTGKPYWVEKTPENIYLIGPFIKMFPDAKIIHIVRDPRDVMLSMLRRGNSLEYAASRWLMPVAAVQNYRGDRHVLEIRYEDLILKSQQTFKAICAFLGVDFHMGYFTNDGHQSKGIIKKDRWESWNLDPQWGISDRSIGKYKESNIDFRPVLSMRLTKAYAHLIKTQEHALVGLARRDRKSVV